MCKKLLSTILVVFVATFSIAQDIDSRLLVKYSKSELQKMIKSNPDAYDFLISALNKGMFIADIPSEKEKSIVFNGTLNIDPNGTHTVFSIGKEVQENAQYYRIAGTNKMVVIQPRIAVDPKAFKK